MKQFIKWLTITNSFNFIVVLSLVSIIIKIPGTIIGDLIVNLIGFNLPPFSSNTQTAELNIFHYVTLILIAPFFETLIGQYIPIKLLSKFIKSNKLIIILSALVFSFLHLPVLGFLLGAFLVGVVFSWGYILKTKKKGSKPFLIIMLAHGLHNLIAIFAVYLLQLLNIQ